MSKLFAFAGTCVENGAVVYKFANDAKRAKALERFGCTDVNMIELPFTMAKEAAIDYLNAQGMTASKPARATKTKSAAKPATVKVKGTKETKIVAGGDDKLKQEWAEAMAEREANGLMPTMSFAEWKRNSAKWDKWTAKIEQRLEAKRAAGKICF